MLPHERSLVKALKGRPFAIVGVNSDGEKKLKTLVKDGTVLWRNFTDKQSYGKISGTWGVRSWPTLYLIDHKGVIKHKGLRGKEMEEAIKKMVKKAEEVRHP